MLDMSPSNYIWSMNLDGEIFNMQVVKEEANISHECGPVADENRFLSTCSTKESLNDLSKNISRTYCSIEMSKRS